MKESSSNSLTNPCPRCKSPIAPGDIYCRVCGVNIAQARKEMISRAHSGIDAEVNEDQRRVQNKRKQRQKGVWLPRFALLLISIPVIIALSIFLCWVGTGVTLVIAIIIGSLISFLFVLPIVGVRGKSILNNLIVIIVIVIVLVLLGLMTFIGSQFIKICRM